MRKAPPSTIQLQYDYQSMSPTSHTLRTDANCYDNQYTSLFGDPVPPPTDDFLHNLDRHLYGNFRRSSFVPSIMDVDDYQSDAQKPQPAQRTRPPCFSEDPLNNTYRVYESLVTPRLGPDIHILPDSGGSSSEMRDSPTFIRMVNNERRFNSTKNVTNQQQSEESNVCSSRQRCLNPQQSDQRDRGHSPSDRRKSVHDNGERFSQPLSYHRQISSESYSSNNDWFKPSADKMSEFTKIPRMRPSSKNVMSINQDRMQQNSPVATLIHDSNGSSSGDDRLMMERKLEPPREQYMPQVRPVRSRKVLPELPAIDGDPQKTELHSEKSKLQLRGPTEIMPSGRAVSPVIVTDAITTGADYRVQPHRSHKKTSFTIISERSPQSSRAPSPTLNLPKDQQSVSKPVAMPRSSPQKALPPSTYLKLPTIGPNVNNTNTSDESPRPSVQFDVSSYQSGSNGATAPEMSAPKSILNKQQTAQLALPPVGPLPLHKKFQSCETLPLVTDPHKTTILRPPPRSLHRSAFDLRQSTKSAPRPISINPNPTRQQRGLLRVINSADSESRIPVASNWASLDDLTIRKRPTLKDRRRSSSSSPERKSSTLTASDRRSSNLSSITTSDFSYRRGSHLQPTVSSRRKSIFDGNTSFGVNSSRFLKGNKSQRKIAKPTTLSPIIGTPNKDSPQDSEDSRLPRRNSLSKIPVRGSAKTSRSSSRVGSKPNSRNVSVSNSRSTSPNKNYGPSSRPSSRADTSRSPSRTTIRAESLAASRAGSRSTSRADSRNQSRSGSRTELRSSMRLTPRSTSRRASLSNSRLTARPTTRPEQRSSFRSRSSPTRTQRNNRSPPKSRYSSPPKAATTRRSPEKARSPTSRFARRKSISPIKRGDARSRSVGRKSPTRRDSRSRIPLIKRNKSSSVPPPKSKAISRDSPIRGSQRKQTISAKKSAVPVRKPQGSKSSQPRATNEQKNVALSRAPSNVTRSKSNLKPDSATSVSKATPQPRPLQKEASKISLRKEAESAQQPQKEQPKAEMRREASSLTLKSSSSKSSLLKKRTDSNLSRKLEKKGSFRADKPSSATAAGDGSAATGKTSDEMEAQILQEEAEEVARSGLSKADIRAKIIAKSKARASLMSLAVTMSPKGGVAHKAAANTPESGVGTAEDMALPAAILEKSQKTLENIQKTVTEATEEIHKTINENLTDLKSLESDMGKKAEEGGRLTPTALEKAESLKRLQEGPTTDQKSEQPERSPQPPAQPIEASVSVLNGNKSSDSLQIPVGANGGSSKSGETKGNGGGGVGGGSATEEAQRQLEDMSERVSERAISVLPEVECESANLQNFEYGTTSEAQGMGNDSGGDHTVTEQPIESKSENTSSDVEKGSGSQEFLKAPEEEPRGCCQCCPVFCLPCRRCSSCKRKRPDSETTAVISEEIDEKVSCWKRMKCCKKKPKISDAAGPLETIKEETSSTSTGPKQGKCGLCLSKVFCCRATNKVEAATGDTEEIKRCCFCIPCRKKRVPGNGSQPAWQDAENAESILSTEPREGGCTRFMNKLKCWKKKPPVSESRRASMKQSNAPTEDTRSKLHVDLVEFNSKMKGAIPVMPLYLAWFCAICNTLVPGLGTVLSGFFCLCVGIPRFSPYDSAKARFGSLIVNCIVGTAQLFCVLFCLVGWGWSIWWGTIMLKTARKLKKIKHVEKLELEEDRRQAAIAAEAEKQKTTDKDVEAAKP